MSELSALVAAAKVMEHRGWVPATSGNLSLRQGDGALISASGLAKGVLTEGDFVAVDAKGQAAAGRPSAETALHLLIYRRFPDARAVLHSHGHHPVVASRRCGEGTLSLTGYELLKALHGVDTHEAQVHLPVVANGQDMAALAPRVDAALERTGCRWAFLLVGHGLYTWGRSVAEAARHLEALDTLLGYQLAER